MVLRFHGAFYFSIDHQIFAAEDLAFNHDCFADSGRTGRGGRIISANWRGSHILCRNLSIHLCRSCAGDCGTLADFWGILVFSAIPHGGELLRGWRTVGREKCLETHTINHL